MTEPHWKGRGIAAAAIARKSDAAKTDKPARDYIGPAVAALGGPLGTSVHQNRDLLSAIIIAQALDRFGERLMDAAAVSQYKRAS